jgi:hypothetical protein
MTVACLWWGIIICANITSWALCPAVARGELVPGVLPSVERPAMGRAPSVVPQAARRAAAIGAEAKNNARFIGVGFLLAGRTA